MSFYFCKTLSPQAATELNPSLPVWFNPVLMEAFAFLHEVNPQICTCFDGNNPVAFLPYYEKKKLVLCQAYNPLLVYYSPLVFYLPQRQHANRNLLQEQEICQNIGQFLKNNYWRIILNLTPDLIDIRGFLSAGLKAKPFYTFTKLLHTPNNFFPTEMKALRKAEKQGFVFNEGYDPESFLSLLYNMFDRKKHTLPISPNKHLTLLTALYEKRIIRQYNVLSDNAIVSSILVIPDKNKRIYGWQSASKIDAQKQGASIFLYHRLFQTLAAEFDYIDLCGANIVGPARLKAALGAELKLFFQIRKH